MMILENARIKKCLYKKYRYKTKIFKRCQNWLQFYTFINKQYIANKWPIKITFCVLLVNHQYYDQSCNNLKGKLERYSTKF